MLRIVKYIGNDRLCFSPETLAMVKSEDNGLYNLSIMGEKDNKISRSYWNQMCMDASDWKDFETFDGTVEEYNDRNTVK